MSKPTAIPTIALTAGEPAGIGPDLCVMLAQHTIPARIVVIADKDLLKTRAAQLNLQINLIDFDQTTPVTPAQAGTLYVLDHTLTVPAAPGILQPVNSNYVLETLRSAISGCLTGTFDAMVTAPVHKGVINDAGFPFTGHTEYLAEHTNTPQVVMMLVGGGLRVALATTHLALNEVAAAITHDSLLDTLRILHHDLQNRFGLPHPRILVAGLNPHAGESGHLGHEEIDIIIPALNQLREEGIDVRGPYPADTLFTPTYLKDADCVFAMYHDQGLPVLKYASFGEGVNVTLGLPIIRTSVDHGTALDKAGTGQIESGSLLAAIQMAITMINCTPD
ncbi:4-hydroxythreonine-4-phosphate dehydrogenase PdxA [Sulfurirhabdus autotrophica]|uniref:4-hydroxythreonine-4-phosphate dehydrogenase n=1 Tax=Sulfurirhabdus autotrophica TaxID=1706046 RepID=A0A4R3Y1X5_9PROT|nr:4-hydroxythreonine-4-phosphate dehydrogenase PdxA [Sulfurirhabdus autotrophica]TCV84698.1 4-hydroxythreonine-4-phosphate dehydrogenase [Sulfurirhabdus autotrophica]